MTVLSLWRRGRGADAAPGPAADLAPDGPREAVVFSGGAGLGAAQVGALQELYAAGVRPDLVVGCSVGALNAAFLAVDPSPDRLAVLETVWRGLERRTIFPGRRAERARRLLRREPGLYRPDGLLEVISAWVPLADLAETAVPCHVVTTDLRSGRPAWWSSGDPARVLLASACLPAVFPPVELAGSLHVDGAVTCPVPVQRALDLGAARVWLLDVSGTPAGVGEERMSAFDVLLHSFAISRALIGRQEPMVGAGQRVVAMPRLDFGRHDPRDLSRTAELLEAGRRAGREMLEEELAGGPVMTAVAAATG